MIDEDYILTLHPDQKKQGVWIEKAKYNLIRKAILDNLTAYGSLTFMELGSLLEDQLKFKFEDSVMWYYTTVKLDIEARGEIRRVFNSQPQLIELGG